MKKNFAALLFPRLSFFSFTLLWLGLVFCDDPDPDYSDCGIIPAKKGAKGPNEPMLLISDGDAVPSITEMPWMVKLIGLSQATATEKGKVTDCTGAIISNWHILTAAHCVDTLSVDRFRVYYANEDWSHSNISKVKKKYLHDSYDATTFTNDIAVLTLEEELQFDDKIRPICLTEQFNEKKFVFEGDNIKYTEATIAGWGFDKETDIAKVEVKYPFTKFLFAGQIQFLDDILCIDIDKRILLEKSEMDEQEADKLIRVKFSKAICAKGTKSNLEKGDDGAPLMLQRKDENGVDRWVVVAVGSGNLERKAQEKRNPSVFIGLRNLCSFITGVSGVSCNEI